LNKPWEQDYVDLSAIHYSNRRITELQEQNPLLLRSCPTCDGSGIYEIKGGVTVKCDCRQQKLLYKSYLHAGIGIKWQKLDWDDFADAKEDAEVDPKQETVKYLTHHDKYIRDGIGMVYMGWYGTGKTFLASLLAKELVKLGYKVNFSTFVAMLNHFTKGWSDPEERDRFDKRVLGADVLILDDLGKELTKNLGMTTLDHILRQRMYAMRPTIFTTNLLTNSDITREYQGAIASLLNEQTHVVRADGYDYRGKLKYNSDIRKIV